MAGNKPNLSSPNHEFDKTKLYNRVVFQQGKPILDVDLNDMSVALQAQATSAIAQKMGYGPSQIDYRDWAMTAVESSAVTAPRNIDNFAVSLGRLESLKGVIDTRQLASSSQESMVIYDHNKLGNNAFPNSDRPWANYILKGKITAVTSATEFSDDSKDFTGDLTGHRLVSYDQYTALSVPNPPLVTVTGTLGTSPNDCVIRVQEDACRVKFITGALTNDAPQPIVSATGSNIEVGAAFSPAPQVGDEYVIIPPNTLESYRAEYDGKATFESSLSEGLGGLPRLLTYVQVFEEDISSVEDPNIVSNVFGSETTHRSQLRWCIRVAKVYISKDGDTHISNTVGDLRLPHIFTFMMENRYQEHQLLTDGAGAIDIAELSRDQITHWKTKNSFTNVDTYSLLDSPYSDSYGITPMHFYSSTEAQLDGIYWSFLKALLIQLGGNTFNDFVLLNQFTSESKSQAWFDANPGNPNPPGLSQYFFPNARTNNSTNGPHAWLSTGSAHDPANPADQPGTFKAPPRIFTTHADLSVDNMKSRTLHGVRGGVISDTAPLVFDSVASHMSFVDQALLGLSGLGSAQGTTSAGNRIPAATNYTLTGTTTGFADAGYGVGAVKPINPLSSADEMDGFVEGSASYLLREKGSRSSHTVNYDDPDLGWSFYKSESTGLVTNSKSDFTVRGWEEGIAQSASFLQGLNFRKLAIKTTAHKSQDLFTISERPVVANNQIGQVVEQNSAATAFQIPYDQSESNNNNLFLDSYSGSANNQLLAINTDFNATSFIPANVDRYDPKPLLTGFQATGGIKGFAQSPVPNHRDLEVTYGAWNRFDAADVYTALSSPSDSNAPTYVGDLWSNRCTAMRLRYHVGDFYPGTNDAREIPSNELVDSMNLFVKVEPLSLAHWMTMPKHQHSILENSISFAEGIEALLKIAHGIGDTQKLVNNSGQPLIQTTSPALSEIGDYQSRSVGDVDPLNLPFEHHRHPFVHWYHPAMHKVQAPHPDGTNDTYTNSANNSFKITPYPKWGRRSMIVPALVPSTFGTATLLDHHGSSETYTVPYLVNEATGERAFPNGVSTDHDVSDNIGINLEDVTGSTGFATAGEASLPYPYHASASTNTATTNIVADDNTTITFRNNQITFPAVGGHGAELRPGPVFLPASRIYALQNGSNTKVKLGFNTMLSPVASTRWDDINATEDYFPYDERDTLNIYEAGGQQSDLPLDFQQVFTAWSVPVMRAAINTHTVAGIVNLVRTSFATGLGDQSLSSDYSFTMPTSTMGNDYDSVQVPAIGPDNPLDTLFVGDLGTALGGFKNRAGFMSPLNLGVPMRRNVGLVPNDYYNESDGVRDSFELARSQYSGGSVILNSFTAINKMGLQQKLMWNCSFRVLHARPSGMDGTASTAPKSITEVFLAHDRTNNMATKTLPAPSGAFKKPFIHLMSTHPATDANFPNKEHMDHLYPMVSDSTGGTHVTTPSEVDANDVVTYDYTRDQVKTSSMGDTYAADPFDYTLNSTLMPSANPLRERDNLSRNSGIEIDLLNELGRMHTTPASYGIDTSATVQGTAINLQQMMPTANELTLPGDHELIFVLYTGHYGAKMYDTSDEVNISYIPSVAGCHLTATLEINRPSDRVKSTEADERHYGREITNAPINTYSIPSTK